LADRNTAESSRNERRPQKSFDHDHSGEGIHVEDRPDASRHSHQRSIDRAGAAEQEQPGRDVENVGRAERYDRRQIGEGLERRRSAHDEPGDDTAHADGECGGADAEHEGIRQALVKLPVGQDPAVMIEREVAEVAGRRGQAKAALDERHQRRDHHGAENEREDNHEREGRIGGAPRSRAAGGAPSRDRAVVARMFR
jgi:hypothetical protein